MNGFSGHGLRTPLGPRAKHFVVPRHSDFLQEDQSKTSSPLFAQQHLEAATLFESNRGRHPLPNDSRSKSSLSVS
jgi:hypothetical protein